MRKSGKVHSDFQERKINSQDRPMTVVILNSKEKADQLQKERISSMPANYFNRLGGQEEMIKNSSSDSGKSDLQSLKQNIKGMSFAALQQLDHRDFNSDAKPKSSSDESKIGSLDSKKFLQTVKEDDEAGENIEEEKKAEPNIKNIQMIH